MNPRFLSPRIDPTPRTRTIVPNRMARIAAAMLLAAAALGAQVLTAQVLTVDTGGGKGTVAGTGPIDRQYRQVEPTHVELPKTGLDPKTRILLERDLQSDQGFANRPFPRGHKGLTLQANGKLEPAGVSYENMVIGEGLSAKPGSRVVITDVKIDKSKIVLDFDGGPDAKHRFLRHIQVSAGPQIGDPDLDPSLVNQQGDPAGSRITLAFANFVPELTAQQVKALLAPLVSFDVKSPVQAFTDTLPPALKEAILAHKVLVGMSTDMLMFSKGQPNTRSREMDGQMPFEEWIYGIPPEEVDFVRINGNRVIRVEIARDGKPLQVFTTDVVTPMLVAAGTPELAQSSPRTVKEGDVEIDPNKQAPAEQPTLRNPGEKLPNDDQSVGVMRPVQFPKPHPDQTPGANPDEQSSTPPATPPNSSSPSQPSQTRSTGQSPSQAPPQNSQAAPSSGTQPSAPSSSAPPANVKSQPPAGSNQLVSSESNGQ